MPPALQIANRRERALVRAADFVLAPLAWRTRARPARVGRILLLRLERIGDLLMTLEAISAARRAWPEATIDLAVGSWNRDVARLIPGITHVHLADLPWLSRGERPTSWSAVVGAARAWRAHHYDLVVNFEPDIRSNVLARITGAPVRAGYATGGGGALLTSALAFDPTSHTAVNALRLIDHLAPETSLRPASSAHPRLAVPDRLRHAATTRLDGAGRPWIGLHASGGRPSKQWHLDRFAEVGRVLAARTGGTIILTGGPGDRPIVDEVGRLLTGTAVRSVADATDLGETAGLLASLDVLVTGDTGPMHLAAAVGTPVVALFGPADPVRYGPRAVREHIVRVDLPCSPCGQVRLPPARCRGHVPDCMDGIAVEVVVARTLDLLQVPMAATAAAR